MAIKAKITLTMAPYVISLATDGPTLVLLMIEPARTSGFLNASTLLWVTNPACDNELKSISSASSSTDGSLDSIL